MKRRAFLKESTMAAAGVAAAGVLRVAAARPLDAQRHAGRSILVDPTPLFELSPYLYMQFMEPLRHRWFRRSGMGSCARSMARGRRGGHT
jgi:alpha-L-arabinofuranosidase